MVQKHYQQLTRIKYLVVLYVGERRHFGDEGRVA